MASQGDEWDLEYTDLFGDWWDTLTVAEQTDVSSVVDLLIRHGPRLTHPYSSKVFGSRFGQMRELRIQHAGRPYRVLYAFDPGRTAILLLGGEKTGQDRWYERMVPKADALLADHLDSLGRTEE